MLFGLLDSGFLLVVIVPLSVTWLRVVVLNIGIGLIPDEFQEGATVPLRVLLEAFNVDLLLATADYLTSIQIPRNYLIRLLEGMKFIAYLFPEAKIALKVHGTHEIDGVVMERRYDTYFKWATKEWESVTCERVV